MASTELPMQDLERYPVECLNQEKIDKGEQVYHQVLDSVGAVVDLGAILSERQVDLNYHLLMHELYSPGAIRATSLSRNPSWQGGLDQFTKHEGQQDIEAFKVRGAFVACLLALKEDPELRDFAAASAGNHGQGVAQFVEWFNARLLQSNPDLALPQNQHKLAKAHIFCKEQANVQKVEHIKTRGAKIYKKGILTLEEASENSVRFVESQNQKRNGRSAQVIHPFNQPEVMAGQSLILLETLHQLREQGVDVRDKPLELYVGGGGFGLANGNAVLLDHFISLGLVHPDSIVIAAQMENCDAMNRGLQRLATGNENMDGLFIDESGKNTFDPAPDGTAVLTPGDLSLALAHRLQQRGSLAVMIVSKAELGTVMREDRAYGRRVEPAGKLAETARRQREQAFMPYYPLYPESAQRVTVVVESGGSSVSDATLQEFWDTYPDDPVLTGVVRRTVGLQCISGATAAHNGIL